MKKYFKALLMTFSMFCVLSLPVKTWDDDARPLMTLFLPVVGAYIGLLWTLLAYASRWWGVPAAVFGAVMCAFPFVITGFIHIDGFMDVTDAVRSCRGIDERVRILKDPHCGAFAVISCILLVMVQFALFSSVNKAINPYVLIGIPVCSRACSGLAVTVLTPLSASQYAGKYRTGIKKTHMLIPLAVLVCVCAPEIGFFGLSGLPCVAVIVCYALALIRGVSSLGGMSGDISGYALTISELCGIAVLALL